MIRYLLSILFRLFKRPVILSMHEEDHPNLALIKRREINDN